MFPSFYIEMSFNKHVPLLYIYFLITVTIIIIISIVCFCLWFLSPHFCRHISTLPETSLVSVGQRETRGLFSGTVDGGIYGQGLLPVIKMSPRRNKKREEYHFIYLERWGIVVEVFRCGCNNAWVPIVCKVPLHFPTHSASLNTSIFHSKWLWISIITCRVLCLVMT